MEVIQATCSVIADKFEAGPQFHKVDGALAPLYKASGNHAHGLRVFSHHTYGCTDEFQLCSAMVASTIGPTQH